MFIAGIVIAVIGAAAVLGMLIAKHKSGRLANTPFAKTGEAKDKGGDKGAISVEGAVTCGAPLTSPVTQTPCLFYTIEVTAKWKVGDAAKTLKLRDEKEGVAFEVDDGSGPIRLVPSDVSGLEDLKKTFDKTKGMGLIAAAKGGPIEFGDHGFSIMPGQKHKGVHLPNDAKYDVEERSLSIPESVYACGFLQDDGSIASAKWQSMLLTTKTRDDYLGSTMGMVKRTKIIAMICLPVGGILAILGKVL